MSTNNGTVTQRKTLSSQLDRLDDILDCLGDGLNEAVGAAVRVAVQETLQGAINEFLTNPELVQTLRAFLAPPAPPAIPQQRTEATDTKLESSPSWLTTLWAWLLPMLCSKWAVAKRAADTACGWLKLLWEHRWSVLSVTSVSVCFGCVSFLLGPVWSAVFAGVGGASLMLLGMAGVAFWRVCWITRGA